MMMIHDDERDRLRALIEQMKEETVRCYNWGQRHDDTVRNIEHLIACALDPAPNENNEGLTAPERNK